MTFEELSAKFAPALLEVSMWQGIAVVLNILENPLSSLVAILGALIALVRLLAIASKSWHEHEMNKIKLLQMKTDQKELERIIGRKDIASMTSEELEEAKKKLLKGKV
jgi:hypothetical protein